MEIALWVAQGLLATAFLMAGVMKMTQSKEKIMENMDWPEDFSPGTLKSIGALEFLAAVGLILPGVTGIAPVLVPVAAVGIIVIMVGAITVHARRSETRGIVNNLVLVAVAAFIAWGRFGDYPL